MESRGTFGFEPDENGFVQFMTVETECKVHSFAEYMELFKALVEVAEDYDNRFMPVIVFNNEQRE